MAKALAARILPTGLNGEIVRGEFLKDPTIKL
jgi:hypothetical protein